MKPSVLILFLAAGTAAAIAQTTAKPAAPAATATHPAAASAAAKLEPAGLPPARGIVKSAFTLRFKDIKLGTGADAEPGKMYKVHYTGYLGVNGRPDDGHKFDSSYDHPGQPEKDKDGKPVLGDDGKPKLGDPQPMSFPQGMGRLIPGFDQGFYGMKVGGKRRLFIPWQLAYGSKGRPGPDPAHPGIPPKADLIFDVELVDVADMPAPPQRPGPGGMPGGRPMPPGATPHPLVPSGPGTPGAPGSAPTPGATPGAAPTPQAAPAAPPQAPKPPAPATPAPATTPQPQSN